MDKESWRRGGDSRPDPRSEASFDELAKGLANGTISRRQALRWMGGALAGAAFASVPGVAFAAAGGNTACDEFCHENFSGREAGECTSAGTQGTGPCYSCTPGIGPGPHFTPPQCAPSEEFNPETCECEPVACAGNPLPEGACTHQAICGEADQDCSCLPTTESSFFCIQNGSCGEPCTSTLDCPEGQTCVYSCCGGPQSETQAFCQFPCGVEGAAAVAVEGGPTTNGG
jgi:hypothetical protein